MKKIQILAVLIITSVVFVISSYGQNKTLTLADGEKYVGEVKDGKPHGQGTSTVEWEDGDSGAPCVVKYVGQWQDGKSHGQGTMTWSDGDTKRPCAKYVGQWKDDKMHEGTMYDSNGKIIGKGTVLYGGSYIGEVKNGKPHGQGRHTYPANYGIGVYVGQFKDGQKHGQGTFAGQAVMGTYVGEWQNDQMHGQGTWTDGNGKYVGQVKDWQKNGQGTMTWPNDHWDKELAGRKYIGQWKDNQMQGQGTLYDRNGKVVKQGIWKDDKFTGK